MKTDMQKQFARIGAQHRLGQLRVEQALILQLYPGLKPLGEVVVGTATPSAPRRRRRTMSAAARKAVSARMKKYWAGKRASKK